MSDIMLVFFLVYARALLGSKFGLIFGMRFFLGCRSLSIFILGVPGVANQPRETRTPKGRPSLPSDTPRISKVLVLGGVRGSARTDLGTVSEMLVFRHALFVNRSLQKGKQFNCKHLQQTTPRCHVKMRQYVEKRLNIIHNTASNKIKKYYRNEVQQKDQAFISNTILICFEKFALLRVPLKTARTYVEFPSQTNDA